MRGGGRLGSRGTAPAPFLEGPQHFGERGGQGGGGEQFLGLADGAPGAETSVHVQIQLDPEGGRHFGKAEGLHQPQQRFRGGGHPFGVLIPEPELVRARRRQPYQPPPALDFLPHPHGLPPAAVEEQDLQILRACGGGGYFVAGRIENPECLTGSDEGGGLGGHARLVEVPARVGDQSGEEQSGAGGAPGFTEMDQNVDGQPAVDGLVSGADAPAWGEQALRAAHGAAGDDAAAQGAFLSGAGAGAARGAGEVVEGGWRLVRALWR